MSVAHPDFNIKFNIKYLSIYLDSLEKFSIITQEIITKRTEKKAPILTCTKTTLIDKISDTFDQKPVEAKETIETLIEIIKSTLASGEDIMISGFGKFQVIDKAPRKGRNPATGDSMILTKRRVVTFKCAGKLKDRMNGTPN